MNSSAVVCFHCSQPVPEGLQLSTTIHGEPRAMCCRGCQAVAGAIVSAGLDDYYRHRTEPAPTARDAVPDVLRQAIAYDNPDVQRSFVRTRPDQTREAALILEGVVCAACVWLNENHLKQMAGVTSVTINYTTHRARVGWDPAITSLGRILEAIAEIGYRAHPYDPSRAQELLDRERRDMLRRLAVAGALGMQVMIFAVVLYAGELQGIENEFRNLFRYLSLGVCLPILVYSASPFFRNAWRDVGNRRVGMDVPVSLGIAIAFTGSVWSTFGGSGEVYFDSVAMFTFFLLTGRYFELAGRKRAAEVSESLVHMQPATATRVANGHEEIVASAMLQPGDVIRVRPGETIAADGRILDGRSSIDESLVTGESLPCARSVGDAVIGGTVNRESPLLVRVEHTGEDSTLSAIVRLLDRAQAEKPAISQAADRAARWFVARVLLLTGGVALYWLITAPDQWLPVTIAVLVATCPCALALATPVAMTAATGNLMQHGLVVTRGHALETLARADTFVFDKTGTLTAGRLRLLDVHAIVGDARMALQLAAALETFSEHPLASVIRQSADSPLPAVSSPVSIPGLGISGSIEGERHWIGNRRFVEMESGAKLDPGRIEALESRGQSVVYLARAGTLVATFEIGDELRHGARELVDQLKFHGKRVVLMSGDHAAATAQMAALAGITDFESELRPVDKLDRVQQLSRQGAVVAMIGDGVNDAAALRAAHVSIAMGAGTPLAAASADMLLLSNDLSSLGHGTRLAVRTLSTIRQNTAWAIGYNLIALPFAAVGWIAPWMAAIGMSASSLMVVANALRLRNRATGHPDLSRRD